MEFLRVVTSILMVMLTPFTMFARLCCTKERVPEGYTDYQWEEKGERKMDDYTVSEYDIYVSTDGDDGADGTAAAPVKTIQRAKEIAKASRLLTQERFSVIFRNGDYAVYSPVVFDENDADNVTYRAYKNEKVSFSTEYEITGWRETQVNSVKAWVCDVPDGLEFNTLTKDGAILPVTRYPESGYITLETTDHSDGMYTEENTPWSYTYGDMAVVYPESSGLDTLHLNSNTVIRVLHYWCADTSFYSHIDKQSKKLFVTKPYSMKVEKGDRIYLENVLEALNNEGEWYYDTDNKRVYYVPCEGETTENMKINACIGTKLFDIEKTDGIVFDGITFKGTSWSYPELDENGMAYAGLKHPQAEYDSEGAIRVSDCDGIGFTCCDFVNLGNTAVKFDCLVKNANIEKCRFNEIGANCIFVHGYNAKETERITENIRIYDNVIKGYGRNYADAVGVLVTHARNCEISHNTISDGYYTAISVGWVWGYTYSVTENNKICNNLIHDIGQGWLSDMGGIYTLGIQNGTEITGNTIHNVAADSGEGGYGGWGVYLDEGSSNILVKNNLAYDCGSQGLHQHYGENNTVTNNIFAMNRLGQVRSSRKEEHIAFNLSGNIIAGKSAMITNICAGQINDENNLYWDYSRGSDVLSSDNESLEFKSRAYVPFMKCNGYYKNAVFENPLFKDAEGFDFNIAENSPAIEKIGFVPWDYTVAGAYWK